MFRTISLLTATLILLSIAGCGRGPDRGTVSGIVTLDGQPIADVFVVLQPEGHRAPQARGISNEAGEFVLHADDGSDGIVVGRYRVTVVDMQSAPTPAGKEDDVPETMQKPPNRIPVSYHRGDKTPLEIDVSADALELDVPLVSTGK